MPNASSTQQRFAQGLPVCTESPVLIVLQSVLGNFLGRQCLCTSAKASLGVAKPQLANADLLARVIRRCRARLLCTEPQSILQALLQALRSCGIVRVCEGESEVSLPALPASLAPSARVARLSKVALPPSGPTVKSAEEASLHDSSNSNAAST